MVRRRRTFGIGFKRQLVEDIMGGLTTCAEASRKHEISTSVIEKWQSRYREGTLVERSPEDENRLQKENELLKAKVGELTMEIDILKKFNDYVRRRRKEDTLVVTAKNLEASRRGAK